MSGPFTRILIATDGSPGAVAAARLGGQLAQSCGAEVLLCHVSNLPASVSVGVSSVPELADDYLETTKAHAFHVARNVLDELGVTHDDVVVVGPPADSIVIEAQRRNCDAIVIGHRGLTAVERFFMGSVTDRVAHKSHCAVIIAPVPDEADTDLADTTEGGDATS